MIGRRTCEAREANRPWMVELTLVVILTLGSLLLWDLGVIFVTMMTYQAFIGADETYTSHALTVREDGQLLIERSHHESGQHPDYTYFDLDGQTLASDDVKLRRDSALLIDDRVFPAGLSSTAGTKNHRVSHAALRGRSLWYLVKDGQSVRLVEYDRVTARPVRWVGANGGSSPDTSTCVPWQTTEEQPLRWLILRGWNGNKLLYSNRDLRNSLPYREERMRGLGLMVSEAGRRLDLVGEDGSVSTLYSGEPARSVDVVEDPSSSRLVLRTDRELISLPWPGTEGTAVKVPLPEVAKRWVTGTWIPTKDGSVFVMSTHWREYQAVWVDAAGHVTQERTIKLPPDSHFREAPTDVLFSVLQTPVIVQLLRSLDENEVNVAKLKQYGYSESQYRSPLHDESWVWIPVLGITSMAWSVLAVRRLRRLGASRSRQIFWGLWCLLWGLPGYLAFRTHRSWPVAGTAGMNQTTGADAALQSATISPHPTAPRRPIWVSIVTAYERALDRAEAGGYQLASAIRLPTGPTALLVRELRLMAGLLTLGMLTYGVFLARLMGWSAFAWFQLVSPTRAEIPFVRDDFLESFACIALGLAVVIGLAQVGAEMLFDSWQFTLHRPVRRRTVIATKLLVGLVLVGGLSACPIAIYGWWCSLPGRVAAPFEWSMTVPAWQMWWFSLAVYLATFLTLFRPARWWGTRCLPLVAVLVLCIPVTAFAMPMTIGTYEPLALINKPGGVLVADICLALAIFGVARDREF